MDEKGVYAIARSLWECDAFMNQRFTQREAWMWLVGAAVWKQTKVSIEGHWVTLERSEFCYSSRFLAKKWKWKKDAVLRFMKHLQNRAMIRASERATECAGVPVYSICKYNDFQVVGIPNAPANAAADAPPNAPAVRQPCAKEETLQTLETVEVEKGAAKAAVYSEPLPDWLDLEAWRAFLEMRRRKRAPVTARATELLLRKLDGWRHKGHDPTAILDASTASAWTNLYEPKAENGKQSNHETFAIAAYLAADDDAA